MAKYKKYVVFTLTTIFFIGSPHIFSLFKRPELCLLAQNASDIPSAVKYAIKMYKKKNLFGVKEGGRKNQSLNLTELMCKLKTTVHLNTVKPGDGPFSGQQWELSLPKKSLQDTVGNLNTCAVVTSAGALKGSSLGKEIDSHDAVLRFNGAQTMGFAKDVGTKTTLRIINSQLVMSEEAKFLQDPQYNTGVLIIWDPAPYSTDLDEWYKNPDFNFHERYHEYRRLHPEQPVYILSPSMLWRLWDVIQEVSTVDIQPNPPSSGMLGIALMMSLCKRVSVYEFLPSQRETDLCHYYEEMRNWQCTLGHYHPLFFEKKMVQCLNRGTEKEVSTQGKVTLDGYSLYTCPETQ